MTRQTLILLAFVSAAFPGALWRTTGAAAEAPETNTIVAIALHDALVAAQVVEQVQTRDELLKEIACELAVARRFKETEATAKQIQNANLRCNVLMILAGERAQAGDVAAALEDVDRIDDAASMYLRSVALKRIAVAQACAGRTQAALETLQRDRDEVSRAPAIEEVKRIGERGGRPLPSATFSPIKPRSAESAASSALMGLVQPMASAGQLETVSRAARRMRVGRLPVLWVIARVQLERKEFDDAVESARLAVAAADGPALEPYARVDLVRALVAHGDLAEASRLADGPWKMPRIGGGRSRGPHDSAFFQNQARRTVAVALGERGELQAAKDALSRLPALSQFTGLVELAESRRAAGDRAAAVQCLEEAALIGERGRVGYYWKDLGVAQLHMSQLAAARASFARALFAHDLGVAENRRVVVSDQARGGDVEGALRSVATIPELPVRAEALDWIASDLARRGRFALARDVAGRIADTTLRATAVARIEELQVRGRQQPEAEKAATSRDVPSPHDAMIIAHCWSETPDGAKEALAWARALPTAAARARAALGAALGASGRKLPLRP